MKFYFVLLALCLFCVALDAKAVFDKTSKEYLQMEAAAKALNITVEEFIKNPSIGRKAQQERWAKLRECHEKAMLKYYKRYFAAKTKSAKNAIFEKERKESEDCEIAVYQNFYGWTESQVQKKKTQIIQGRKNCSDTNGVLFKQILEQRKKVGLYMADDKDSVIQACEGKIWNQVINTPI